MKLCAVAFYRACAMLGLAVVTITGLLSVGLVSAPQAASGATAVASPAISAPPDVVVSEFDSQVTLPVTLSAPGTGVVTVNYTTTPSTAGASINCNGNYVTASGTLTFEPGVTTQSVVVTLLHCNLSPFASFTFNLSTAVNGTIIRPSTRIGIVGDSSTNVSTNPGLYVRDAVVDNSAGTIEVPVLLGGTIGTPSASTVTVNYTTTDGSAVSGTDYSVTSGTLTFGPGETVQNVAVPIIDRSGAAPARSFSVTLSGATNATIVDGSGVVTIGASGATAIASPNISAPPDVVVSENDGYVDLPVTLSAPGTGVVTVNYTTTASTAGASINCNGNYVAVSGTLTFEPGETAKVVRVDLLHCNLSPFASFTFNLSTAVNGTIIRPSTRIGIVGDSSTNVSTNPGLYVRDAVVDNSAGTIEVPVLLGGPIGTRSASTVTVNYTTTGGSAVAGTDYAATSGTLTFGPGETVQNVAVPIIDRSGAAPARSFSVTLSGATNATIVDGSGVVTIGASGATAIASPNISAPPDVVVSENDGYVDLPVTLSAPGTGVVTVNYTTTASTAGASINCNGNYVAVSGTLTFEPGETAKVVRVDLLHCNLSPFASFTFNLSTAVNGTIIRPSTRIGIVGNSTANVSTNPGLYVRDAVVDNSAGTIEVPVLLGGPIGTRSASTVTVNYTTTDGSAVSGTDYSTTSGTLTFGPGETVQNIPVPIIDRSTAAPTRRFSVTLSGATNATIVDGTGVVTIGASGATAVASPNISAPPDVVVSEDDGYVDLPVTLSAPGTGVVTVNYATANSTASGSTGCGFNFVPAPPSGTATVTFEPGVTTQVVRVDVLSCNNTAFVSFTFNLSSAVNGTIIRPSTRIGIVGNSTANVSTNPGLYVRDAVVDNSAGTIEVPVLLGGPIGTRSASTVTVNYTTTDGSAVSGTDYSTTSGTLTFGPGETVQNIPVPIIDRSTAAPTRRFSVTLSGATNATIVDGTGVVTIGASGATAVASPNISAPPDVVVSEDDGYVDLPVTLSAPGTGVVTVNYATANSTASGSTGCGFNFVPAPPSGTATVTFEPGVTTQVVRVDVLSCNNTAFVSFTFNLSSAVNGTIIRPSTRIGIVGNSTANVSTNPGLYVRDAVVDNSAGTIEVPVLLGGPIGTRSASTVTVNYTTTDGSAVSGTDYSTTSGTLTFGPGETVQNIPVPIIDRSTAAPTRRFSVTLSGATNATIVDGTGVVTIGASGATAVASPNISAPPDVVVSENDGYVDLPVTLSAPGTGVVTVHYATANGTALSGTGCGGSYVGVNGTLTFEPGLTTQVVRVDVLDCNVANPGTFTFCLSSASNGTIGSACTTVTIVESAAAAGGLTALTPARILDTRNGTGGISGPVASGHSISLNVLGVGGVPASGVSAVVLNVTATAPSANGYLTVYPDGASRPTTSNLNFSAGETVPNLVIATVGSDGKVDFYNGSSGTVQVLADVSGWFASGTAAAGGLTALTPARILDTRNGTGGISGPVASGHSISLNVLGVGGVPASGVSAVVLNVTATAPSANGYLTVYPDGASRPTTSNLNFSAGETVPNLVIATVGSDGKVDFYNGSSGTVQVLADVSGWFASGTAAAGGLTALTPARILDTRNGTGGISGPVASGHSISLNVLGVGGVPASGVSAVVLNVTATAPSANGYLTVYPDGASRPTTSNLNFSAGETVPNLVIATVGSDGKVDFYNGSSGTVQVLADVSGWFS